jgi:HAD superfamily hydrolase (TIGR01458 family)
MAFVSGLTLGRVDLGSSGPSTGARGPKLRATTVRGKRGQTNLDISGFLIDLDGTVYEGDRLVPGAATALEQLRSEAVPFLFTTNTSRKSRRAIIDSLAELGLPAGSEEVLSAPVAAAAWLRAEGIERIQLLVPESTHEDFDSFLISDENPEAVLVGDLGSAFTFDRLNSAFRSLRAGARLVAIHRNRFWLPATGPTLDAGPFVAALEFATGVEATLVGKPSPAFFRTAAELAGVDLDGLAVVGDDVESDIRGARAAGLVAIQVRTGKFDADQNTELPVTQRPDQVIDSIRDLPGLLSA